uniref:Uncharacterized protein n=1 Tax=Cacopsylla melanoneura TaxID=428564 RepID=A0A8D8YT27_9HEMI
MVVFDPIRSDPAIFRRDSIRSEPKNRIVLKLPTVASISFLSSQTKLRSSINLILIYFQPFLLEGNNKISFFLRFSPTFSIFNLISFLGIYFFLRYHPLTSIFQKLL